MTLEKVLSVNINNCVHPQEEMTRLQKSIEDLKIEFGDEADDQKVI